MTQVLDPNDTGEIPGSVYRTDQTSVLPLPEETARLRLGESPIFDLRPARPDHLGDVHRYLPGALDDRPYPPVPPLLPPQPTSLTGDLLGDRPAWAQRGSAGEYPVVRPAVPRARSERDPGRHRAGSPRWARVLITVGLALVAESAVALAVLAGVKW